MLSLVTVNKLQIQQQVYAVNEL